MTSCCVSNAAALWWAKAAGASAMLAPSARRDVPLPELLPAFYGEPRCEHDTGAEVGLAQTGNDAIPTL
jgi:hypothetical protein